MRELSFNEWMVYIHEQLNYPQEKIKQYETIVGTVSHASCRHIYSKPKEITQSKPIKNKIIEHEIC